MNQLQDSGSRLLELVRRREETLETLSGTAREKPALVEKLGVSRSTVDRATAELTRVGLVCRVPGGYRTTTLGESLLDSYRQLRGAAAMAMTVEAVGETPGALVPPPDALAAMESSGATTATSAVGQQVTAADGLCVMVGAVDPAGTFQLCHDLCVERGVSLTLVIDRASLARIRDRMPDGLRRMASVDDCRVFAGEVPDDGLWIVRRSGEKRVVFTVRTATGEPVSTLTTDDGAACQWAEETFADYAIAATEVTASLRNLQHPGGDCRV